MHFPDLTEMGEHYQFEEGTEGVRRGVLDSYAAALRDLTLRQDNARTAAKPPVSTGSVRDRINFFSSDLTKRREDAEREVRRLQGVIDSLKTKLARQGGKLLPNGDIDWTVTSRRVVYDNDLASQGLTKLHIANGMLYTNANHVTKFDTMGMVTAFGGKGWAIYVMSETGSIHASPHSVGYRHHSSLLAGADVAGAGEMRVLQGKLVHLSNKSGHYAPAAAHFLQVIYTLRKRGASLFGTKITFKTATGQQDFASVEAFMQSLVANGMEADFGYSKLLAYLTVIPKGQFDMMAAGRGWRWVDDPEYNRGLRGVVSLADGSPIPHRDVRKWLKSQGYQLQKTFQRGDGR